MTEEPRDRKDHKAIDSALLTIEEAQAVGLLPPPRNPVGRSPGTRSNPGAPSRCPPALWHGLCDWDK